ncbi:MAG: mechanosensitive ion channel family protein [Rhizobiaceae bacterium]|nr:mechanosensitive ion channel family protein [Hyphomicrobiales bacterium]NRB31566.1 mechanosensitive ion channel family protein [Rhizobiaceae bacterium]
MPLQVTKHVLTLALALLFSLGWLAPQATAQLLPEAKPAEEKAAVDPLGRTTPRGTVEGYLSSIRAGDIDKAAKYLDVSEHPEEEQTFIAKERAKELILLLDRNGDIFDINKLSPTPDGNVDDGLDADLDEVGVLDAKERKVPLLVQRKPGENDLQLWLFESGTINRVPFLLQTSEESLLDRILPEGMKSERVGEVSTGHWAALAVAAVFALAIGLIISWTLSFIIRFMLRGRSKVPGRGVLSAIVIPFGVVIGVSLYRVIVVNIGVQLVARDYIAWIVTIASMLALAWLGVRLVDGISEVVRYGMSRTKRLNSVAVVMLAKRMAKAVVLGIALIAILEILGFDVSTGLAALGIGGIALALGAQKTIENLVGSITVVVDRPVSVGDFCKFGDVMGTVEDIGIRSTQVRTLDRTIVTVPNGAFASMQIENYSRRDEFRLYTVLTMRYETTPAQVRFLLAELHQLLKATPEVTEEPARVRFIGLGSHSLDIEIFGYVQADDYAHFLTIQEEMLLSIMDIVKQSGTDFAFPSQTLYFGKDHPPEAEKAEEIAALIEEPAASTASAASAAAAAVEKPATPAKKPASRTRKKKT